MAAGVGYTLGRLDQVALGACVVVGRHFGEAVGPAVSDAVGGRGVDDAGVGILDQGDGFAGGVVRQAKDDGVGGIEGGSAGVQVLALVIGQAQQLDVAARRQALADLQAGRAGLAVDKDLMCHRMLFP